MPASRKTRKTAAPASTERRGVQFWLSDTDLARLDAIQAANPDLDSRSATVRYLAREYTQKQETDR